MKTKNSGKMIPGLMVAVMMVSSIASVAPAFADSEAYQKEIARIEGVTATAEGGVQADAQLADPMTDMFISLSGGVVKSIAGKFISSLLFPSQGIDYARIRQDMADVTRQAITEGEITKVEGLVNGANGEALALVESKKIDSNTKYEELDRIRPNMARDLNGITKGQYAKPGLAHYLSGAQAEISMLANMKGYAHEIKNTQKEGYADTILQSRLQTHIDQISSTKANIIQDRINDRVGQIGECDFQTMDYSVRPAEPFYWFKDNGTGQVYQLMHYGNCYGTRNSVVSARGNEAAAAAQSKIGWMDQVVTNWKAALQSLKITSESGLN
jgi:hypothetical protein